MTTSTLPTTITCSACDKVVAVKLTSAGKPRAPKGWKRVAECVYCTECKGKMYRLRAITIPIARVIEGGTWQEFGAALRAAWGEATNLSNWAVHQLWRADRPRSSTDEKLAPLPRVDLYKSFQEYEGRERWTGAAANANAIFHAVEARYRKRRYEVLWRCEAAMPTYRYPTPYQVYNTAWTPAWVESDGGKVPTVSVSLGGRRWVLALRTGSGFRRQLGAFAQIVTGEAIKCALMLVRSRSFASHRREVTERTPGGARKTTGRPAVKLVAYLPRTETGKDRKGSLELRTGHRVFLVGLHRDDDHPWLLHNNGARGRIARHARLIEELSHDLIAERNLPRGDRRAIQERLDMATNKHHRWLDTFTHTQAKMVGEWAARRNVAVVNYDDTDRRYFPSFPWGKFALLLDQKLDDHGIRVEHVASGDVVESQETAETPQSNT